MLGVKIFCWAYAIYILMCRIVNHDVSTKEANVVRIVDNVMIVILLIILFIAY